MAAELTRGTADQPPDLSGLCLSITEHAPLPMAMVEGASHLVRYINPAFCRLIGMNRETLIGKPLAEIMPDRDGCITLLDRVYRTGEAESHTEPDHSKPHPIYWSYILWPLLADERLVGVMIQVTETAQFHQQSIAMSEALMLSSVRQHELTEAAENLNARLRVEIAERKQAEEALHRARAQLADRAVQLEHIVAKRTAELTATNKQLEAFVYSIAHDLRAPLRSMHSFSELLVEEAGTALSETARDFADRISTSARFMDALLTDLLAFSAIAQQRIELSPVNLETAVQSVLSRLEESIQEKNARVEILAPWPVVLAHEPTLGQVLFNLVNNALKFVARDVPPLIRIWAEERMSPPPSTNPSNHSSTNPPPPAGWVRVCVEDNGIGIAPEYQEQIFRLFTRLHGYKYSGTGVGLAIVQKGIERMGGRVGMESAPGQGSRFWFELQKA